MPVTQRENIRHSYLSCVGSSLTTTEFLLVCSFTKDYLGCQILGVSRAIENNGLLPPTLTP